jgi:hypothetical protein
MSWLLPAIAYCGFGKYIVKERGVRGQAMVTTTTGSREGRRLLSYMLACTVKFRLGSGGPRRLREEKKKMKLIACPSWAV